MARPAEQTSNFGVEYQTLGARLAGFKLQPSVIVAGSTRPLFPGSCGKCTPDGLTSLVDPHSEMMSLRNILEPRSWCQDLRTVVGTAQRAGSGVGAMVAEWLLLKWARFLLPQGLVVSPGQIEVLERASKQGLPFLFLSSQQNLFDNFLVGLALRWAGMTGPVVVNPRHKSGRGTGWWWAAVGVVKEPGTVGQLEQGRSVQVFGEQDLEKVCDATDKQTIEDVMIVPVTTSYSLLSGVGLLWAWLRGRGQARVDIDQPFRLKEYLTKYEGTGVKSDSLAKHVVYNRLQLARITCEQLLGFLIHTRYSEDLNVESLARSCDEVRDVLGNRKVDFAFSGDSADIVVNAVGLLGGEVRDGGVVHLEIESSHLVTLSSAVSVHYVPEAFVACAVQSLLKDHLPGYAPSPRHNHTSLVVSMDQTLERADLLVRLLRPVLAPPCANLNQHLNDGLERLKSLEAVGKLQDLNCQHAKDKWVNHMARQVEIDDDYSGDEDDRFKDVLLCVGMSDGGRKWFEWLLSLTRPMILTYFYTTSHLHTLREEGTRLSWFVDDVKEEIRKRKDRGYNLGVECGDDKAIRDCLDMLVSANVVMYYEVEVGGEVWLNVKDQFDDKLDQIIQNIHMFL